jgi:hypothetical protein
MARVYLQDMARASASLPPPNRSEIGRRERQSADAQGRRGEGEPDKGEQGGGEQDWGGPDKGGLGEVYGPLDIERNVKDDGRTLILYSRREPGDE